MMKRFAYRVNLDLTTDSICLRCFRTAASAPLGIDISAAEATHVCVVGEIPGENRHYATDRGVVMDIPTASVSRRM